MPFEDPRHRPRDDGNAARAAAPSTFIPAGNIRRTSVPSRSGSGHRGPERRERRRDGRGDSRTRASSPGPSASGATARSSLHAAECGYMIIRWVGKPGIHGVTAGGLALMPPPKLLGSSHERPAGSLTPIVTRNASRAGGPPDPRDGAWYSVMGPSAHILNPAMILFEAITGDLRPRAPGEGQRVKGSGASSRRADDHRLRSPGGTPRPRPVEGRC